MLDEKLFQAYINRKSDPIEEILGEALDVENFEYDRSTLVKGSITSHIHVSYVHAFL